MRTELARPENEYSGVRLTVGADISGARLLVQIDIGFGGPTFDRRNTRLPAETPIALTSEFSESPTKQAQWRAFLQRTAITHAPAPLPKLMLAVTEFVMPPTRAALASTAFDHTWEAGPWT